MTSFTTVLDKASNQRDNGLHLVMTQTAAGGRGGNGT